MKSIFSVLIAICILGCNQQKTETKKDTPPAQQSNCSDKVLPLGLKFGMSASEIDSLITDGTLEKYAGADKLEGYKVFHGGKTFIFSLHKNRLKSLVAIYTYNLVFEKAFLSIREKVGLFYVPGGNITYAISPWEKDFRPNTLPYLPSELGNVPYFGTICNDMLVVTEEFGPYGRIWYTEIPNSNDSLPEAYMKPFQKTYPHVTSIYRKSIPDGFYRPLERDY